jgi:hypothetical protein
MPVVLGVDPHHAGLERTREPVRAAHVVRPKVGGQAVAHVVRERERVLFVGERDHGEHGPEDLLLRHAHAIVRGREHRRLYVVAALRRRGAADRNRRALGARDVEVSKHLLDVVGMNQRPDLGGGIDRVADLDRAHARRKPLRELALDGFVHEQAARRRAALAVQAVDHEHDGVERPLQVRVVEHDDGVLAAELEVQALQRRRGLRHDRAARGRLADERDGADARVLGGGLARRLAEAVHRVQHAGRQARRGRNLGEQRGRDRAPLGGLVNHRAAGCERRRDLPRRQHERRVPRRDSRHGAEWLAQRVIHVVARRQRQAAARFGRLVCEEAEVLGTAFRRRRHEPDRLARVERLEQRDLFGARLDRVGDRVQPLTPLAARQVAPRRERTLRRVGRCRNVGRAAFGHGREHGVVDRRARVERSARLRRALRAVDEILHAALAVAREILLGLRGIVLERRASGHDLPPRRFTCSCRLFFLKFSTGWNSCTFREIARGLLS